ncbi:Mitochondrial RNA-splicing protein MRS3 [Vitis vinifera]|uniref:Mitochondrial RNA-splicing protein MRS3 n=1 Tax=Vitis vinifera TaxID=29760 RepID=A0A438KNU9_VITVI|nr:Mitochondrial RNA-splicing protein MRS3 [Vitis vinifera]
MATDATPKFQNRDFRPVQPDFHPEITMSAHDGLHFWQFMVAGSIAGCVEHMAMFRWTPLRPTEGPSGLYRGIGAMGLGAGPAHAVYFSIYEIFKKSLSGGNPNNSAAHAISGVFATVASDAVFTPMDMVKQRLQLSTVHFATYEAAKRGLMEVSPDSADDNRVVVHATAGAAAGALAALLTTPLDVVKTQLQCQLSPAIAALCFGICTKMEPLVSSLSIKNSLEAWLKWKRVGEGYGSLLIQVPIAHNMVVTNLAGYWVKFWKDSWGSSVIRQFNDSEMEEVDAFFGRLHNHSISLGIDDVMGICGCDRYSSGSIRDVLQTIVKKDGYRGLMRGWIPRMLFHAPAAAICWSTYEAWKSIFQELNAKSDSDGGT